MQATFQCNFIEWYLISIIYCFMNVKCVMCKLETSAMSILLLVLFIYTCVCILYSVCLCVWLFPKSIINLKKIIADHY